MKAIEIFERIQAATPDDKLLLLSFLTSNDIPVTADLLDADVPLWKNVKDLFSGAGFAPTRLNYAAGTALPLPGFTGFQTLYSAYGPNPRFTAELITGGGWLTASITTNTTTASNGTYTAKAIVNDAGVYSATGIGSEGTATFVVLGGVVTSVTKVAGGACYNVGDTFTCADVPGATFAIATNSELFYQDITSQMTKIKGEITDQLPDSFSINVDDDGTGLLGNNIQITIST